MCIKKIIPFGMGLELRLMIYELHPLKFFSYLTKKIWSTNCTNPSFFEVGKKKFPFSDIVFSATQKHLLGYKDPNLKKKKNEIMVFHKTISLRTMFNKKKEKFCYGLMSYEKALTL